MKREHVKSVAIEMAKRSGLINLSRRELCERAGIPDGSFPHVMGCTFTEFITELRTEGVASSNVAVNKRRVSPTLRKEHLVSVAIDLAIEGNYMRTTRDAIAERAGVSMGLVTKYFGTMQQLRNEIMRRAVVDGIPHIVAQGLAAGDKRASKAPAELKTAAAQLLVNW